MKKLYLTLLSLFIAVNCYGEGKVNAYPRGQTLPFLGLDDTSNSLNIKDGRAASLQNVKLSRSLSLTKRDGYQIVNGIINHPESASDYFAAATGLYYAKLSDGTEYRLATVGKNIWYDNSGTWTNHGYNVTRGKNNQFVWTTALDSIVFTNNVDIPLKSTGIATSALNVSDLSDALTTTKAIVWFKNYLIHGNTTEAGVKRPTRFRWSDVGTIETYQDDNFIDIAALSGQEIESFAVLGGSLYALLTDSIWKIDLVGGDEIFVTNRVIDGIGCIAKNSVQGINFLNKTKGIIFLSKDKRVYFFDGTSIVDMSAFIKGTMNGLNVSRLQYAVSAENGIEYFLSVTDGTASINDLLLVFQYEIGEWTEYNNVNANAMAKVVNSDGDTEVFFGNYDSIIYQLENNSIDSDVTGQTDGVSDVKVGEYNFADGTATGLTMVITDTTVDYLATGAILKITSGTGTGEKKVIVAQSSTGLVVDSAFTATPTSSSLFSIGAIDANYTTKWYDLGMPSTKKGFKGLYLWAEEESGVSVDLSYAIDFTSVLGTESVSLQGEGGLWGVALWNDGVWGGQEALLADVPLTGKGRYINIKYENNEVDEDFVLLGTQFIHRTYDIQ